MNSSNVIDVHDPPPGVCAIQVHLGFTFDHLRSRA